MLEILMIYLGIVENNTGIEKKIYLKYKYDSINDMANMRMDFQKKNISLSNSHIVKSEEKNKELVEFINKPVLVDIDDYYSDNNVREILEINQDKYIRIIKYDNEWTDYIYSKDGENIVFNQKIIIDKGDSYYGPFKAELIETGKDYTNKLTYKFKIQIINSQKILKKKVNKNYIINILTGKNIDSKNDYTSYFWKEDHCFDNNAQDFIYKSKNPFNVLIEIDKKIPADNTFDNNSNCDQTEKSKEGIIEKKLQDDDEIKIKKPEKYLTSVEKKLIEIGKNAYSKNSDRIVPLVINARIEFKKIEEKIEEKKEERKLLEREIVDLKKTIGNFAPEMIKIEEARNELKGQEKLKLILIPEVEHLKKERDELKDFNSNLDNKINEKQKFYDEELCPKIINKEIEWEKLYKDCDVLANKVNINTEFYKAIQEQLEKYKNDKTSFFNELENSKMIEEFKEQILNIKPCEEKCEEEINYEVKESFDEYKEQLNTVIINSGREYDIDFLMNVLICITQNFITVFAGNPGTGKTSFCQLLAKSMGIYNTERYVEVSVEKGWTSPSDLIGYYNSITKEINSNNIAIVKALNILNKEYDNEGFHYPPLVMMLDEANLSPIEYYWSSFNNIADKILKNDEKNFIEMRGDKIYNIPKHFRFLATINYDNTTEMLSPRFIDRAWIIRMPDSDINILSDDIWDKSINAENVVSYNCLIDSLFAKENNSLDKECKMEYDKNLILLEKIIKKFEELGHNVSPRVITKIKNYIKVAIQIFNKKERALDYAVAQKLLININGYGDDYLKIIGNTNKSGLCKLFSDNKLTESIMILDKIINKGKTDQSYSYFGV